MKTAIDKEEHAAILKGSFLEFTKIFYKLLTGLDFIISNPIGRESHQITIARELVKVFRLEESYNRLIINVCPGSGKSTILAMWVAWCLAQYPDSKFIYLSYVKSLATKHTSTIKRIIQLPEYGHLFGVRIRHDSKAKEFFETTHGGAVAAFGTGGAVTGQDAGMPGLNRFSGAVIIDDAHKPDEVHSSKIRQNVIQNYDETIKKRPRDSKNVPIIFIGQTLHEDDLSMHLRNGKDGYNWKKVILKSLDDAGNALYPEAYSLEYLLIEQKFSPYSFAAQHQQDPVPAGGALFKPEWFVNLYDEPDIFYSFITVDTAETSKTYNDATAFSFWGIYEIKNEGINTGEYGIHWIDCEEIRVEPKDLKQSFLDFYSSCLRYKCPPKLVAIEKKSTGGTLLSLIDEMRAIRLLDIPRTRESGNKTKRFLDIQPYLAERRVSFPSSGRHVKMCIDHMSKITANETHRWDDIADTAADAVKLALIDKIFKSFKKDNNQIDVAKAIFERQNHINRLKSIAYKSY